MLQVLLFSSMAALRRDNEAGQGNVRSSSGLVSYSFSLRLGLIHTVGLCQERAAPGMATSAQCAHCSESIITDSEFWGRGPTGASVDLVALHPSPFFAS